MNAEEQDSESIRFLLNTQERINHRISVVNENSLSSMNMQVLKKFFAEKIITLAGS